MEQIILGILECQAERIGSVATQGETGTPRVGQQEWVTVGGMSLELRVSRCQVWAVIHMRSGTWQRTQPLP